MLDGYEAVPRISRSGTPDAPARDIDLVNTYNLRDLGGYATGSGLRVRWRRLFRGAGLQRLSGGDLQIVRDLGLRTVIDLRTEGELDLTGPCPTSDLGAAFHHLPILRRVWERPAGEDLAEPGAYLAARYREMLDEGAEMIAEALHILARPDAYPAVFYCAAGKDRTGVLAALVLDAVGVVEDDIVFDYHLSGKQVQRMIERARARAQERSASFMAMVNQPPEIAGAPPQAMRSLLAWIREHHGSTGAYLREIGVGPEFVRRLADNLLERSR